MGVASAGLEVLAFLPDAESAEYVERADLSVYGDPHAVPQLRLRVEQTRLTGFAVNPGLIVEGGWGMGAAVFDVTDSPVGVSA